MVERHVVNNSYFIFDERSASIAARDHQYSLCKYHTTRAGSRTVTIFTYVGVASQYCASTRCVKALVLGNFSTRGDKVKGIFRTPNRNRSYAHVPTKSIVISFPRLEGGRLPGGVRVALMEARVGHLLNF